MYIIKMGYAVAWINIQVIVQNIFEMPWYYDTEKESIIVNPKRKQKFLQRFLKMPTWIIVSFLGVVTFIMCIHHIIKIGLKMKIGEYVPVLETLLYCTSCVCTLLGLVTIYSAEKGIMRCYSVIDTIDAIFVEGNVRHMGVPTTERLPNVPELIAYGIMAVFLCCPIITATWPLILDVDPINRDLKDVIPEIPRRIMASVIYSWVTHIAANACGLFLILILACCHIFETRAEKNSKLSKGVVDFNQRSRLETVARIFSKYLLKTIERIYPRWKTFKRSQISLMHNNSKHRVLRSQLINFAVRNHDHNTMRLLMDQSNQNMAVFLPTLAGVGIILCIVGNYGSITFYDRDDLRVIWCAAVTFTICIYWMILFFCHHAATPLIYTEETIRYWKGKLCEKLERKQVRAMMTYGFTLGPFFRVKPITAFDIMDAILNNSITFLLASNS